MFDRSSSPVVLAFSAALWGAFAVSFWYTFGSQTGELLDFTFKRLALRRRSPLCFGRAIPLVLSLFLSWQ